jgi:RNA polymerase sigma factor (sigma-70 family)
VTLDRMSDAELIAAVRRGDSDAYGVLYERHLGAAQRAAACLVRKAAEREDLVADAFTKVLRALRDGGGPREEFRAYLLVTLRNAAISTSRGAGVSLYAEVPESYLPGATGDPVLRRWDAEAAVTAFASLPERWRTVLWHTEVEDETPAEIAPLLGMRPNGVAALAYRAREGLRQAYLRAHLADVEGRECRATVSKLAGWVRRSVPDPLSRKISRHLAACPDCRSRAATLETVNSEMRATIAPLLLGASLAAAYLPAAAPASGVVVKSLLAKAAVVTAIAATAVTTVASAPHSGLPGAGADVPVLAESTVTAETTIQGPPPVTTPVAPVPPAPTTPPAPPATTLPPAPQQTPPGTQENPQETQQEAQQQSKDAKAETKAQTKAERKAEKDAAKEAREEAKAEAKEARDKAKGK